MALLGAENKIATQIKWQEIETVFLDLDGTLLDLNFDMYFWLEYLPKEYAKKNNISVKQAQNKIFPMLQNKQGTLDWYCLDYWQKVLEINIIQLKQNISYLIKFLPSVEDFLISLQKDKTKKIILTTNAHRKGLKIKFNKTNIQKYFDLIISSHDYGFAKQDQLFWHTLANKISFNKETSILFDDSQDVIQSAKIFGIKNIIAMSKPNSKEKAKKIKGFINIDNFSHIMPI